MRLFPRRQLLVLGAALCGGALIGTQGHAQARAYPDKPILIKVGFPAGGPADASIRAAVEVLQRNLGENLLADNLPGANGSISAMKVLGSPADGYTLLGTTGTDFLVAPLTIASAKYRPDSFSLVGVVGISDFVLVSSSQHSFKNVDELIDYAKNPKNPQLSIAHWGIGSTPHIVAADFQSRTGVKLLEIPYKGAAPTITDVAGGQVDLTFIPLGGPTLGMIQNGKFRPIGLASEKRNAALPNVPTFSESRQLKDFEYSLWSALLAPPKTPEPVIERLTSAMNVWVMSPENQARIATNASRRLEPMTPAQAASFLKSEYEKFNRVARSLKLSPQ